MTQVVLNESLSQFSLLFVSSAMAFLALALVLFSFQLVKLSAAGDEIVAGKADRLSTSERAGFVMLWVATLVFGCWGRHARHRCGASAVGKHV